MAAPSTVANPLQQSLARIAGEDPLSQSAGTSSLISYDDTSAGFRNPQGDVISITSSPGTGATTAETWSHEVALENLKREQMEFQYTQQQNEISNALRQSENLRAVAAAERDRQAHELSLQQIRAQMASQAEENRLRQEAAQREAATFMKETGHAPSYYTSGQADRDTRDILIKNVASLYGSGLVSGSNNYAALRNPREAALYGSYYNTARSAVNPITGR
jgi:hypothetical protein